MQTIANQLLYNVSQRQKQNSSRLETVSQNREQIVLSGWMLPSAELKEEWSATTVCRLSQVDLHVYLPQSKISSFTDSVECPDHATSLKTKQGCHIFHVNVFDSVRVISGLLMLLLIQSGQGQTKSVLLHNARHDIIVDQRVQKDTAAKTQMWMQLQRPTPCKNMSVSYRAVILFLLILNRFNS